MPSVPQKPVPDPSAFGAGTPPALDPGAAAPGAAGGQPPAAQGPPAPPVDPSQLPGVETTYFAVKLGGESGKPVGLFRVADDDDAEVLTLERLTSDGSWEDDPALIDDIHQPGVYAVEQDEADSIQSQILAAPQQQP